MNKARIFFICLFMGIFFSDLGPGVKKNALKFQSFFIIFFKFIF